MTAPVLQLEQIRFRWPGSRELVLDGLDLRIDAGESVFLAGASGSGKSSLLALVGGLVQPENGSVRIAGTRIDTMKRAARDRFRAEYLGVIFQQFNLLPWLSPVDNVLLGCRFSKQRATRRGLPRADAERLLDAMGIASKDRDRSAGELSVGQQQRVAAARALIGGPELVLADEPTSALDEDRRDTFLDLLFGEIERSGAALLFVSHDRSLAERFDRSLELDTLNAARGVEGMLMRLARGSLANRRFAVAMTVFTIAISIALLVLVEQMRGQMREGFQRSVSGVDLIVGAPTAPVQLLLYSVFGLGDPTANVSWDTYQELSQARTVDWAVPISLGDTFRGYRVIGTTPEFFERFRYAGGDALAFSDGTAWTGELDVVLGAQIAREFGLALGDEIELAHGGGNVALVTHDAHPFTVRGILAPTGTPIDQSLYIDLFAHEAIHADFMTGRRGGFRSAPAAPAPDRPSDDGSSAHDHHHDERHDDHHDHRAHDHAHDHDPTVEGQPADDYVQNHASQDDHAHDHAHEPPDEVTAIFLGLTARAAAFGLQRTINEYPDEPLLAILPGIALQQLWRIAGLAEQILRVVAGLVVLAGLLGMLTALLTTLNERRREMAILRACGARPSQIAGLLLLEAALITVAGVVLGVLLAYGLQWSAAPWLLSRFGIALAPGWPAPELLGVLGLIGVAGVLVALIPATLVYRRTVADGMQVRQ